MTIKGIRSFCKKLHRNDSGNALLLMALGMPVLIGGSGLAVDVSQWYVWKRELQYAVDQSALAGAWASAEPQAADDYVELAELEFFDNLSVISEDVSDPVVVKADYDSGTNNSVVVTSDMSRTLPFSDIVWGGDVTVSARAQASFQAATNYTTCLLALDPDDPSSFVLGGSTTGTVTCGMGALSNSATAMVKNGNPEVLVNDLIAAGGIDQGLAVNGAIHQYVSNLSDPYADLVPPQSTTPQSYSCGSKSKVAGTATADVTTTNTTTYTYWQGKNKNSATQITYSGSNFRSDPTPTSSTATNQTVADTYTEGQIEKISSTDSWTGGPWNTSNSRIYIWEKTTVAVTKTYKNVTAVYNGSTGNAMNLQPGTYGDIKVTCETFFNPGVYYVTGTFDLGQNQAVRGSDVLFVLTGSGTANFSLNSNSIVNFAGITKDTLMNNYGVAEEDADRLKGMIIFDKNSTADIKINGGANVIFEGVVYTPLRTATFNGNSSVNGKCMMLAAAKLVFTGTNDFSSFCIPPDITAFDIGGTTISVRLVA